MQFQKLPKRPKDFVHRCARLERKRQSSFVPHIAVFVSENCLWPTSGQAGEAPIELHSLAMLRPLTGAAACLTAGLGVEALNGMARHNANRECHAEQHTKIDINSAEMSVFIDFAENRIGYWLNDNQ